MTHLKTRLNSKTSIQTPITSQEVHESGEIGDLTFRDESISPSRKQLFFLEHNSMRKKPHDAYYKFNPRYSLKSTYGMQ